MRTSCVRYPRAALSILVIGAALACGGPARATLCGSVNYPFPYNDVAAVPDAFCPGIMEAYVLGVTRGTTATTFTPNQDVPRLQMTTFLQRSIDQVVKRGNRRAALGQWWTSKTTSAARLTGLPGIGQASFCKSDGEHIWVAGRTNAAMVSASTGEVIANVSTGSPASVVVVNGSAFVAIQPSSQSPPGGMLRVRPQLAPPFFNASSPLILSYAPNNLVFDGDRIWTANYASGSVAIVPLLAQDFIDEGMVVGGFTLPIDVVHDGSNVWVVEADGANRIRKLDANGAVLQTVPVGNNPAYAVFDGANIWVPNHFGHSITVVQASTGAVVATITANASNRLAGPLQAAFDGERILVTNAGNDSVTIFRAADLSLLANIAFGDGTAPFGACSDGINFWVVLSGISGLVRL